MFDKLKKKRLLELNELAEFHAQAYENVLLYKEKTKRWHDKHILPQHFHEGQQVVLYNSRLKLFPGKLKSRWSGPFIIHKVHPHGAVEIKKNADDNSFKSKQLLQVKGFVYSNEERFGLPQEVYDIIAQHGWEKFARHPDEKDLRKKSINVTLVKEFYAHFTDPRQGTVYVRAECVEFTAKAINKFFELKKTADLHTSFVNQMNDQNIYFLLKDLCLQGVEWDEANTKVERDRLKPTSKLWMHFLKQNLMPTSHTATANLPRLQLLHSILNFRSINFGQLIMDEAFAGITRKQSPLLFPRMITALCHQKGVMEDESDFYIRGRQGIKSAQSPSLMGYDEDATARVPPGGARTIAAARLAEPMAMIERSQIQIQDMQDKLNSLFHYMRERDQAIESYFLELLPKEVPLFPIFPNDLFQSARATK
ncbi:hypothetical protein V6N12_068560 [Hibiscus sabdariffa]|uniref:Putative plant transposon protein domain-containing protein n=1 Tax=Hibiscus sabdariffa TaxID=183260 RepID=A0ABR2FQT9_9ROSI